MGHKIVHRKQKYKQWATKYYTENNQLTLMDEVLTPDSSRFWSKADYRIGTSPKSFDKQIVRDYLETLDWDKPHLHQTYQTISHTQLPNNITKCSNY